MWEDPPAYFECGSCKCTASTLDQCHEIALRCLQEDNCPFLSSLKRDLIKRKNTMNYTTAVFLINPDARAIQCTYDEKEGGTKLQSYTFKTLDKAIKVDDLVVVPTSTRHNMTVVKVVAVDIDIDVDTPHEIKWVVGKVDLLTHQKLLDMEAEAITTIKAAEMRKKREELAKTLSANTTLDLTRLPMSTATDIINGEVTKKDGTPAE